MGEKSILIVEDDEVVLETFKEFLTKKGYDVDTAMTGREAVEKSKARFYNLALLDIKLPDMEGTELLTKLHEDTPGMMKIMITGYPDLENTREALNKGADAYLVKPVTIEKLLETIKTKLKEQEEAEQMSEEKIAEWIKSRVRKLESKE